MKLSKLKLVAFFGVLALLVWALYPRGMLLGYIYEGLSDLSRSEHYYLDYLQLHPTDKHAVMRLSELYDRMGEPQKGIALLSKLYDHRPTDPEVGMAWLDHLENVHDDKTLYAARLKVAKNLLHASHPPQGTITDILEVALSQARWMHRYDDIEKILLDLIQVGRDKSVYREELRHFYSNLKDTDKLVAMLKDRLSRHPDDLDVLEELLDVDMAVNRDQEAETYVQSALQKHPTSSTLLQLQLELSDKHKQYERVIAESHHLLDLHVLSSVDENAVKATLANALLKTGHLDEALAYYQQLLNGDRSTPDNWLNVASVLDLQHKYRDEVAVLQGYLKAFPDDLEQEKTVAEIDLYQLKDLSVLPLYRAYVQLTKSQAFAMDVGNALADAKQTQQATQWLIEMHALFPHNTQIVVALAGWFADMHNTAEARHWYRELADMTPTDMALQLVAGRELLALGDPQAAEPPLQRVVQGDPDQAEAWFWLSEIHSQTDLPLAKQEASRVVALMSPPPQPSPLMGEGAMSAQHTWMVLHSRMRIQKNTKSLLPDYAAAVAQFPNHTDLQADQIDIMIEAGHYQEARERIDAYQAEFPNDLRRVTLMDVRLAYYEKKWKTVIAELEPLVAEAAAHPDVATLDQWGMKRDLGEAYYQDGQWWKALSVLEQVQTATGNRYQIADTLFELHKEYDTRVTPLFNYTRFGSEYFTFGGVQFKDYITHNWELNSEMKEGYFASPSSNYTGYTETGSVRLTNHTLRPWHFSLGVEGAGSTARTTASPTLIAEYKPMPDTSLQVKGIYRQLRQDIPQAVAFGDLLDTAQIQGQTVLFDRLVLAARYWFERDYLSSGASAHGSNVEPSAQVIIFKKPYVTLGWQMDYVRLNTNGNFLNVVPLIPYMNAQYVTGLISGRPVRPLLLEGGFYDGQDFDRGLSIMNGDLWGVRGMFEWTTTSWLDIFGSYEFGRQRLLNVPGYSTFVTVGLSGHW